MTLHRSLPRPYYLCRFIAKLLENAPWHEVSGYHVAERATVPACQAATAALPSHLGGAVPAREGGCSGLFGLFGLSRLFGLSCLFG